MLRTLERNRRISPAHKEHERAPGHLIYGHGGVEKADIHELGSVG